MLEYLRSFDIVKEVNITVIGDIILDQFIGGEVKRISPESPVPILEVSVKESMLGGAGNVIANIVSLGGNPKLISVVGDDENGKKLSTKLNSNLIVDTSRTTSVKTRYHAGGKHLLRVDEEETENISNKTIKAVYDNLLKNNPDVIILSDYGKGVCSPELVETIIAIGKAKIFIDPKGDWTPYTGADFVTPNLKELQDISNIKLDSEKNIFKAAKAAMKKYKIANIIVTLGQNGMMIVDKNGYKNKPTISKEVFDVSGAGDTVVATLALFIGAGFDIETAVDIANTAAGLVVQKPGTATVKIDEVISYYKEIYGAEQSIEEWKRQGLRIGFTNGCFDIFHAGHVKLLTAASKTCDKLIVGLNSDESIRRVKGTGRPVIDQASRKEVIEAIGCVDKVIIFDEDDPIRIINEIKPDVLIKGADYKIEEIIGGDIVTESGGEIVLIELKEGFSSTSIIGKLNPL